MNNDSELQQDPHQGVTYVLLSEAVSRRLRLDGEAFVVIGHSPQPRFKDRMLLACKSLVPEVSRDLCLILAGTHHATRVPKRRQRKPPPVVVVPEAGADAAGATTAAAIGKGRGAYTRRALVDSRAAAMADARRAGDVRGKSEIDMACDTWLTAHGCDSAAAKWHLDQAADSHASD